MSPLTAQKKIVIWLSAVAFLVFCLVVLGGATRLTHSGLSITEWQPILGAIPPLTSEDWHSAFTKYREIPEFKIINPDMTLAGFKMLYWWEWSHRFLARFTVTCFLIPLLWFWLKGELLPFALKRRLAFLFFLFGAQGALGWYMVQSGLQDRTDVSQYRLAAHLVLACCLFGALLWTIFDVRRFPDVSQAPFAKRHIWAFGFLALVLLQIIAGAFVAGLDAGMGYNTWPLMDGALIPSGLFAATPWWRNFFENVLTVQFQHRLIAYSLLSYAVFYFFNLKEHKTSFYPVLVLLTLQATLGIVTLLLHVPLGFALAHQAVALFLLSATLKHVYEVRFY